MALDEDGGPIAEPGAPAGSLKPRPAPISFEDTVHLPNGPIRAAINTRSGVLHFLGADDRAVGCVWRFKGTNGASLENGTDYKQHVDAITQRCHNCTIRDRVPHEWTEDAPKPPAVELVLSECGSGISDSDESAIEDGNAHIPF